ncbi:MAG: antiterminator LoaP [Lachnospiraceae bacterium]|nr:antiterminator LoaP [Lachnospiraceae bacterium]
MWYVVQVRAGTEERIRRQCISVIDKRVLEQCFVPYYKEQKKYQGTWHTEQKLLFPGYVFMVSNRLEELYQDLQRIIGMTRLLGTGDDIVPLQENEIELMKKMGAGRNAMEVSTGIIEKGSVVITQGPLAGMEGCIRKIDRHKRKAWLEVSMFGRTMKMEAGLEVIEKR